MPNPSQSNLFDTILIANRGEIACRIIRTAKCLGYKTVAVFSEADTKAPHVEMADMAFELGSSPVVESYLNMEKILQAAKNSGAQAIHPGYGFFSENADFARACEQAGIVFIGPSAESIELMGNKAEAKRQMLKTGVPCVPGYEGPDQSDEGLLEQAAIIGVPIMVKAAAGGGGRGMRLVQDLDDFPQAVHRARSEAKNAFGSGELILEKAIVNPRHVEVQVFADQLGNTIHLGERDCSVQRRHQKVIEEAPCPILSPALREKMGAAAVSAAKSIDYAGAGTVEFLLDQQGEFYFLEMNTRLQVEHPVTELITGLDLVALQLQVAQGGLLGLTQRDINLNGHAIEVRLYAEDPAQDFLPTSGTIELWHPAVGDGVRVDDGIVSGQSISPFYDPMVAKISAWGANREEARRRLITALQNTALFGITNNKAFLTDCLKRPSFIRGEATTSFIQTEFNLQSLQYSPPSFAECAVAAVIDCHLESQYCYRRSIDIASPLLNWASAGNLKSQRWYELDGIAFKLNIESVGEKLHVSCSELAETMLLEIRSLDDTRAQLRLNDQRLEVSYYAAQNGDIKIDFGDRSIHFVDQTRLAATEGQAESNGQATAPMHGLVQTVMIEVGQKVKRGDSLLVLEAMKMQHEIVASMDGQIITLLVKEGVQVAADQVLLEIGE